MSDKPSKLDQLKLLGVNRLAKNSGVCRKINEPASVSRSAKAERAPGRDSVPAKNGMGVVASPTPEAKKARAPRGTFDRKTYQRELMRKRRAEGRGGYERKTTNPKYKGRPRED